MSKRAYPIYKSSGIEWLGEIPAHWEIRRLKTVARFGYGDSLASDARNPGDFDVYGRETAKIDMLISKVGESISMLREYRTALISAAVTGKIDVRKETSV